MQTTKVTEAGTQLDLGPVAPGDILIRVSAEEAQHLVEDITAMLDKEDDDDFPYDNAVELEGALIRELKA